MPSKGKKTQSRSASTTNHSAPTNNPTSQADRVAIIQRLNDPNQMPVSKLTSSGSLEDLAKLFSLPLKEDIKSFKVKTIFGDGNCLFRAIIDQLNHLGLLNDCFVPSQDYSYAGKEKILRFKRMVAWTVLGFVFDKKAVAEEQQSTPWADEFLRENMSAEETSRWDDYFSFCFCAGGREVDGDYISPMKTRKDYVELVFHQFLKDGIYLDTQVTTVISVMFGASIFVWCPTKNKQIAIIA